LFLVHGAKIGRFRGVSKRLFLFGGGSFPKVEWGKSSDPVPTTTISEIADELNFSDQSALTNFFRTKAGITPLAYRKGKP
jgi:AraC-like DNA-binding protein